jgi:DNA replication licensing factor MCM2
MTDEDRTSIHEAMEQQSISISKAGIVATLQARCSVVAAANPIGGRYDTSKTFSENVQLTDPILTRFDVLCVLRDEIDPIIDAKLAGFVVGSHLRSHPVVREILDARGGAAPGALAAELSAEMVPIVERARVSMTMSSLDEGAAAVGGDGSAIEPIDQELLRKYIVHARTLKPSLTNIDQEKVAHLYTQLRRESEVSNGIPIAVRHIESIMRISEAVARMRLQHMVSDADLNLAIRTTLESFVSAQKAGVQRTLRAQFGRYLQTDTNNNVLLLVKLRELVRKELGFRAALNADAQIRSIRLDALLEAARAHGITDVDEFLRCDLFLRSGFAFDANNKLIMLPV